MDSRMSENEHRGIPPYAHPWPCGVTLKPKEATMVICKTHGRQESLNGMCIKCLLQQHGRRKHLVARLAAYAPVPDYRWLLVRAK